MMKDDQMKRYAALGGLVSVLLLVSFLLFYYGRQHKVIIDNRAVELADGQSFRPVAGARAGVDMANLDGEKPPPKAPPLLSFRFWPLPDQSVGTAVEMMPRERIMVKTIGPAFNLKVNVLNAMGEVTKTIDTDIELGAKRDAMVRLVKLANGLPGPLEEFPDDSRPAPPADDGGEGSQGALGEM